VAHEVLGSRVERHDMSVYDLSPEAMGTFDVGYSGDPLLHLRDPNLALQSIRSVTREYALAAEPVEPYLTSIVEEVLIFKGGA